MTEPKKNHLPLLPMLIALVLLSGIFYLKADAIPEEAATTEEEVVQSAMALPEDKIIRFVVDRVSDALRLVPQRSYVNSDD